MPELPEVETIRRDLESHIIDHQITSVHVLSPKTALPNAAFFKDALLGKKVVCIDRRGKLLIFCIQKKAAPKKKTASQINYLLVHLKMTGQLIYSDAKQVLAGGHSYGKMDKTRISSSRSGNDKLPNSHTRVIIEFSGRATLYFNDLRKFGYMKIVSELELNKILNTNYGPEPLTPAFTVSALEKTLQGRKLKIKALLLDQKRISGLGNIYVDEALYAARIKPSRLAGSLSKSEIKILHHEINRIIKAAVKNRGTTFSDYVDSSGKKGNFSRYLQVYGKQGSTCPSCGSSISKIKLAGRGTHYCPKCQV